MSNELKEFFEADEMPDWLMIPLAAEGKMSGMRHCNPIDRCYAICKHLFELMPSSNWIGQYRDATNWITNGYDIELSINPFLHTDITEITREDLGL